MDASSWKAILGESAWKHVGGEEDGETVARVLTAASEVGFTPPDSTPTVSPDGAKVLWPGPVAGIDIPALTAAGLLKHWEGRGHRWLALRIEPLMSAVRGPLLPWFQAILSGYERDCGLTEVDPVPTYRGETWRGFVGGRSAMGFREVYESLEPEALPKPTPVQSRTVAGPGK